MTGSDAGSGLPRSTADRRRDTLRRLEQDVDLWVATAHPTDGTPHLVPLSFLWEGSTVLLSTPESSPTARNLVATSAVKLGVGTTRDVVLIEGAVAAYQLSDISTEIGDAFAAKTGFDPRLSRLSYLYFRVTPRRIRAWREENELSDRELMREGEWRVS